MRDALLAWPRLATIRLINLTYRLWFWGILLALVLMAVPINGWLQALAQQQLPGYISSLVLLLLAALLDRLVGFFLSKQTFWGACEALLQRGVAAKSLASANPALRNLRPQRLRGDVDAWRTSLKLVEDAMTPRPDPVPGARDAAQRISPWVVAGALLCVGDVLAPWVWPQLLARFHMTPYGLTLSALWIWLLISVLLGWGASTAVASWIRTRCQ